MRRVNNEKEMERWRKIGGNEGIKGEIQKKWRIKGGQKDNSGF